MHLSSLCQTWSPRGRGKQGTTLGGLATLCASSKIFKMAFPTFRAYYFLALGPCSSFDLFYGLPFPHDYAEIEDILLPECTNINEEGTGCGATWNHPLQFVRI